VVSAGAAIRIQAGRWKVTAIQAAIGEALTRPRYRESARRLQQSLRAIDGRKAAAAAVWDFAIARLG